MVSKLPSENDLPSSLLNSITTAETTESLEQISELALDGAVEAITKSDSISGIPIIGIFVGIAKGILGVRDWLYVRKLLRFLSETSKATDEQRKNYAIKIANNPKEHRRASVAVLEILDRITGADKAALVGKVYHAYMIEDNITYGQLRHLVEMIDKAYLSDLHAIQDGLPPNYYNLENVGIMSPIPAEEVMSRLQKHIDTDLGMKMRGLSGGTIPNITNEAKPTATGLELIRILREY